CVDQLNRDSNAVPGMADPPLYDVIQLPGIADGLDGPTDVLKLANGESRHNPDRWGAAVRDLRDRLLGQPVGEAVWLCLISDRRKREHGQSHPRARRGATPLVYRRRRSHKPVTPSMKRFDVPRSV